MQWKELPGKGFIAELFPPLCLAILWWFSANLAHGTSPQSSPNLWFAVGVYFSFFLINPPRRWPSLILAALLADFFRQSQHHWLSFFALMSDSLAICLVSWHFRRKHPLSPSNPLIGKAGRELLFLAAVIAPFFSVGLFMALASLFFKSDTIRWLLHLSSWSLGFLTVAPGLLSLHSLIQQPRRDGKRLAQDVLIICGLCAAILVTVNPESLPVSIRTPYLVFPLLIWISLRGRIGLTASANMILAALYVHFGHDLALDPPLQFSPNDIRIHVQFVVGTMTLVSLILTLVVHERMRATELVTQQAHRLEEINRRLDEENRLRRAAEEKAFEASQSKSRFLASMSHEIRNPLGAMLGFTEILLQESRLDPSQREYLEIAARNGKHLRDLLDQILDLSKIEAGQLDVNMQPLEIGPFMQDLVSLMRIKAKGKGLVLVYHVPPNMPRVALLDEMRTRQILINALGNAIKFTERGYVSLRFDAAVEGGRWVFDWSIEDTGIGLDSEERGRIFQAFSQANSAIAGRYGGTGLGLTLSRHLAQLLGGTFELIRSEKAKGSTFRLRLDGGSLAELARHSDFRAKPAFPTLASDVLRGLRILVADDAADNRTLSRRILELSGMRVEEACDGQEAVDKVLATAQPFDFVILDLQMPRLSGFEALLSLRSGGYRGPILALTGSAMPDEISACLEAGFNEHLAKPIEPFKLISRLDRLHKHRTVIASL